MKSKIEISLLENLSLLDEKHKEQKRNRRNFLIVLRTTYFLLISLLGLIVYISFVLEIPKINIFNF